MTVAKRSYVPGNDSIFSTWAGSFVSTVGADIAAYGVSAEELTELQALEAEWNSSFTQLVDKRDAAKAATSAKDSKRQAYESMIRKLAQKMQNDPNVEEFRIIDAGLPAHSTTKTPNPIPTTAPIAAIETCAIREHFIRFTDWESSSSRAKPRGVIGIEVWLHCGEEVPVDDNQYQMYAVSSRMSVSVTFDAEQAGKSVYYRFRYLNSKGQTGPWSMVYSSTVVK